MAVDNALSRPQLVAEGTREGQEVPDPTEGSDGLWVLHLRPQGGDVWGHVQRALIEGLGGPQPEGKILDAVVVVRINDHDDVHYPAHPRSPGPDRSPRPEHGRNSLLSRFARSAKVPR